MKITWITSKHHPDKGGMAVSSNRIVSALKSRGHDVYVIHLAKAASQIESDFLLSKTTAGINAPQEPERLYWALKSKLSESSVFIGFGGDIAGYLAVLWAKWLNKKSFVLFRGNDFEKNVHNIKTGWHTHFILENSDLAGAVSIEMTGRIQALRKGLVIYTPNGINPDDWTIFEADRLKAHQLRTQLFEDKKPVVAMFGHLKYKKGLDTVISLFISFEFRKSVYLLTVGEVSALSQKLLVEHLHECWRGVPFVQREYLLPYYLCCDVVFLPSYYDGMPNVLLEAMSVGVLAAASRAGAMPDVLHDKSSGLLFDSTNLAETAHTLYQAISLTADEKRIMCDNARNTILENYTVKHECDNIENALFSLI
ncbi:glycosyltransferase [Candidatus Magnetoovum chiemensis]|nr:glycosyltransferase [Candidatus Magnetoovum chiemensis]